MKLLIIKFSSGFKFPGNDLYYSTFTLLLNLSKASAAIIPAITQTPLTRAVPGAVNPDTGIIITVAAITNADNAMKGNGIEMVEQSIDSFGQTNYGYHCADSGRDQYIHVKMPDPVNKRECTIPEASEEWKNSSQEQSH